MLWTHDKLFSFIQIGSTPCSDIQNTLLWHDTMNVMNIGSNIKQLIHNYIGNRFNWLSYAYMFSILYLFYIISHHILKAYFYWRIKVMSFSNPFFPQSASQSIKHLYFIMNNYSNFFINFILNILKLFCNKIFFDNLKSN